LELIQVAGDKLALGGVDVGERPQAIVFQFEDVVGSSNGLAIRERRIGWMRGSTILALPCDLNFIQIDCNRLAVLRPFIAPLRTPCLNEKLDAVMTFLCSRNAYK
jgi:hypothetical protein